MLSAQRLDSLTGRAEPGKSCGIAPSNGPSGWSELERTKGGHVIAKNSFSELNGVGR